MIFFKPGIGVLFIICCFDQLNAQQLLSSSGGHSSNGNTNISWTVGELMIETLSSGNIILTQGELQPRIIITSLDEAQTPDFKVEVFPNPASQYLYLSIEVEDFSQLAYELCDITGKILENKEVNSKSMEIPFLNLPSSTYLLKIFKKRMEIKTFKIIKK